MRKGFDKVKHEYKLRAALLAAAYGVCAGVAAAGILLIALKCCAVVWGWYLYLVIGVLAAAACAPLVYFFIRPTDEKLAKQIDKAYSLDEQAQTMVEFASSAGPVVELQRQTAEQTLSFLPKRRPSLIKILIRVLAVAVAAALLAAGIAISQKYSEIQEEPPYAVDSGKIALLNQLITDVKEDDTLDGGVQAEYITELNVLLEKLDGDNLSDSLVEEYVQDSMYNISDITINATTYDNIALALTNSAKESTEIVASALRSSAKSYGETNITLTSYDQLGASGLSKLSALVAGYLEEAGTSLTATVNSMADDTVSDVLEPVISSFEAALTAESLSSYYDAMFTDGGLDFGEERASETSGDALYDALYDLYYIFYYANARYSGQMSPHITTAAQAIKIIIGNGSETDGEIYQFVINGGSAMEAQAYSYLADAYVRYTLSVIFDVAMVGNSAQDGGTSGGSSGEGEGGTSGGGGTGETIYPGDDQLYNPSTGGYSYYYEMLNDADGDYLNKLYEMLDNDDISDEVKGYIRSYIAGLL